MGGCLSMRKPQQKQPTVYVAKIVHRRKKSIDWIAMKSRIEAIQFNTIYKY